MTYNKTTWANGDTITAEKLNNIEEGIYMVSNAEKDNGNFIIEVQWDESEQKYIMNNTFEEIETAYRNNKQLKAQLHTLSLDLRGVEQSMAGNKYIFTKMSPNAVYEDSTTASIEFIAITISNYQITYATKTASLELQ